MSYLLTEQLLLDVVKEREWAGFGTIKADVLDKYNLDDTKENRALIGNLAQNLKDEGLIFTGSLVRETGGYAGKGYCLTLKGEETLENG